MNRRFLEGRKVLCLNVVSSPGSGKTTILEKTISHFIGSEKIYVIEGDQQTLIDADRIERAGAPAIQINTGSGCHLDAQMVESALKKLDPETNSILFIENVGNLVCPAMFDLGENKRVIIISVTEGEDKPLKYPYMFESSHMCIINKSDLLPYVDFRTEEFKKHALLVNPHLEFIPVSAKTGEGMNLWFDWILSQNGI
jgi:hydrogenase nickel incorporation protein HypB